MGSKGRKRKRKDAENTSLVFSNGEETFWEVDQIIDRRVCAKRGIEYLVKWKGCRKSEATWEPTSNLCDTAMEEANEFDRKLLEKEDIIELGTGIQKAVVSRASTQEDFVVTADTEGKMRADDAVAQAKVASTSLPMPSQPTSPIKQPEPPASILPPKSPPQLEDGRWYWTDEEQIIYREVERINVNDDDAQRRVTDARLNGTPIVLVGHTGWANFARPWLRSTSLESMEAGESTGGYEGESDWLDLSKEHVLDINRMIADIGNEIVPVIGRDYNEENPLTAKMKASAFLKSCWPDENGHFRTEERHYLHQWQFPLQYTAGRKLCHKSRSLPNNILGEDLLKYWLDLRQCKSDSPLQYLFMGRDETMSKLHRDNGGLAISIAPIVGVKECVLVHRSDGGNCFYHLNASLDCIDLDRHPLMAHARIWKTCIKPGEILLMPQGTYHQCRNVTPCLSYSRFHLDTVNLLPFFQSMIDGDAEELDHGEIIWNSCIELMARIDSFTDLCQEAVKSVPPQALPELTDYLAATVDTLRKLLQIVKEVAHRLLAQKNVKSTANGVRNPLARIGTVLDWKKMVADIDACLHYFRHRSSLKPPSRVSRKVAAAAMNRLDEDDEEGLEAGERVARMDKQQEFGYDFDTALLNLPDKHPLRSHTKRPREGDICELDQVIVRIQSKEVLGTVIAIEPQMHAAYLIYDGFPGIYNEYQPYGNLRLSIGGESNVEINPKNVKVGMKVLNKWGDTGEEYHAVIERTCCRKFFSVRLELSPSSHIDRWLPSDNIVARATLLPSTKKN